MRLWAALLKFGFKTDLLGKNSAGPVAFDFSNQSHALVMLYVQFLCSDLTSEFMWKIYAAYGNLLTDGWSWQIFVSSFDIFNCLFHSTNTMKYSFHQDSSFIHCWFVYWVSSWEVRCLSKSSEISLNGTVFVFHLAWYVTGLKSHKRFRPYLMASRNCILMDKPE